MAAQRTRFADGYTNLGAQANAVEFSAEYSCVRSKVAGEGNEEGVVVKGWSTDTVYKSNMCFAQRKSSISGLTLIALFQNEYIMDFYSACLPDIGLLCCFCAYTTHSTRLPN